MAVDDIVRWRFNNPPRWVEGMPHADVWMWEPRVGYWVEVTLVATGVDPNAGGSPSPVEDLLEERKGETDDDDKSTRQADGSESGAHVEREPGTRVDSTT